MSTSLSWSDSRSATSASACSTRSALKQACPSPWSALAPVAPPQLFDLKWLTTTVKGLSAARGSEPLGQRGPGVVEGVARGGYGWAHRDDGGPCSDGHDLVLTC